MANRYSRSNGAYQARPNQAANAARAAEGVLSTPLSFVIRLALVVILVAVFGVRMVLSGGDSAQLKDCLLYTSPSPRDKRQSRMPSSA